MPIQDEERRNFFLSIIGSDFGWAELQTSGLGISIHVPGEPISSSQLLAASQILNSISFGLLKGGWIDSPLEIDQLSLSSINLKTKIAATFIFILSAIANAEIGQLVLPHLPGYSAPAQQICKMNAKNVDGTVVYWEYFCASGPFSGGIGLKNRNVILPEGTNIKFHFITSGGEIVFSMELDNDRTR